MTSSLLTNRGLKTGTRGLFRTGIWASILELSSLAAHPDGMTTSEQRACSGGCQVEQCWGRGGCSELWKNSRVMFLHHRWARREKHLGWGTEEQRSELPASAGPWSSPGSSPAPPFLHPSLWSLRSSQNRGRVRGHCVCIKQLFPCVIDAAQNSG